METTVSIRNRLISLTDTEWFDGICEILKRDNSPTTKLLIGISGREKPIHDYKTQGSMFLEPYDKRFRNICINPLLTPDDQDKPLDYLSFWGDSFRIKPASIHSRFRNYRMKINTYDGGTQLFFYPVPSEFEFTAIDCWTEKEEREISDIAEIELKSVTFMFGERLSLGRDGFHMNRL